MAIYVAKTPKILLGGFDLSSFVNQMRISGKRADLDNTTAGSGGVRERLVGMREGDFAGSGFYDADGTSAPDEALNALQGLLDVPVTYAISSGTEGSLGYTLLGGSFEWKQGGQVNTVHPFEFSGAASDSGPIRATVMRNSVATGSSNGTAFQLGALSATQRIFVVLHVFNATGTTPQIALKLQSSVDQAFTSPTDRITLTAAGARSYRSGSLLGVVTDTWWRVTWTITGTGPSVPFIALAGIV